MLKKLGNRRRPELGKHIQRLTVRAGDLEGKPRSPRIIIFQITVVLVRQRIADGRRTNRVAQALTFAKRIFHLHSSHWCRQRCIGQHSDRCVDDRQQAVGSHFAEHPLDHRRGHEPDARMLRGQLWPASNLGRAGPDESSCYTNAFAVFSRVLAIADPLLITGCYNASMAETHQMRVLETTFPLE